MPYKFFNIMGRSVRILSPSSEWLNTVNRYYPLFQQASRGTCHLEVIYSETSADMLDVRMRLPDNFKNTSGNLNAGKHSLKYSVYINGDYYCDISGVGRMRISDSKAEVLIIKECALPDCYKCLFLFENVVANILSTTGLYSIHAALAEVYGKGILITGPSGRGKSTASFALISKGHKVHGDERILVGRDKFFSGASFGNIARINENTVNKILPIFKGIPPLFTEADGLYYRLSDFTRLPEYEEAQIKYVIILNRVNGSESRISSASISDVEKELLPVTMGITSRPDAVKLQFIKNFLGEVRRYRFDFGTDMNFFASLVEDMILSD